MVDDALDWSMKQDRRNTAVEALASIAFSDDGFEAVLERVTQVAKRAVDGAFEVSVTLETRSPVTAATTSPFACAVDEAQYDAGYGPCLDALRDEKTVVVDDQTTETRWPQYSPRAVDAGVGSSVSVPLLVDGRHVAALNIYGNHPRAFTKDSVETAEEIAQYAAVVLSNAELYAGAQTRGDQLQEAMASRAVIEQAKGVLMGARKCDADEAFGILVRLSQQTGRKLNAVAQALMDQVIDSP